MPVYPRPQADKQTREVPRSSALVRALGSMPRAGERSVFPDRRGVRYETLPGDEVAPTSKKAWRRTLATASKTQEAPSKPHLRH